MPQKRRLVVASSVAALAGIGGRVYAASQGKRAVKSRIPTAAPPTLTVVPAPVVTKPVLVAARATNGMVGFVKKTDLELNSARKQSPSSLLIPVYAEDGKTVIGKLVLEPGAELPTS